MKIAQVSPSKHNHSLWQYLPHDLSRFHGPEGQDEMSMRGRSLGHEGVHSHVKQPQRDSGDVGEYLRAAMKEQNVRTHSRECLLRRKPRLVLGVLVDDEELGKQQNRSGSILIHTSSYPH